MNLKEWKNILKAITTLLLKISFMLNLHLNRSKRRCFKELTFAPNRLH